MNISVSTAFYKQVHFGVIFSFGSPVSIQTTVIMSVDTCTSNDVPTSYKIKPYKVLVHDAIYNEKNVHCVTCTLARNHKVYMNINNP